MTQKMLANFSLHDALTLYQTFTEVYFSSRGLSKTSNEYIFLSKREREAICESKHCMLFIYLWVKNGKIPIRYLPTLTCVDVIPASFFISFPLLFSAQAKLTFFSFQPALTHFSLLTKHTFIWLKKKKGALSRNWCCHIYLDFLT